MKSTAYPASAKCNKKLLSPIETSEITLVPTPALTFVSPTTKYVEASSLVSSNVGETPGVTGSGDQALSYIDVVAIRNFAMSSLLVYSMTCLRLPIGCVSFDDCQIRRSITCILRGMLYGD